MNRLVDVYPYRKEQNRTKFLIFTHTADVIYPNQWRMTAEKSSSPPSKGVLRRESEWGMLSHKRITRASNEHSEFKWIVEDEIERYIAWLEQQWLMKLISNIVVENEILEEWIIKISK